MTDPAFWQKLAAVHIGGVGNGALFAEELAKLHDWTRDQTAQVIKEYRRYLYLVRLSEGAAVAAPVIDVAWRLHISKGDDYWDTLCAKVLERRLDYLPYEDLLENGEYAAQHALTLKLYEQEFDEVPSGKIWGHGPRVWINSFEVGVIGVGFAMTGFGLWAFTRHERAPIILAVGISVAVCGIAMALGRLFGWFDQSGGSAPAPRLKKRPEGAKGRE